MKKRVTLVAVLAALLVLTVVGCSFTISERNILGTWYSITDVGVSRDFLFFEKDGTGKSWSSKDINNFKQKPPAGAAEFNWTLSGEEVTIKFVDEIFGEWVGYSKEAGKIDFDTKIPDGWGNTKEVKFRQN